MCNFFFLLKIEFVLNLFISRTINHLSIITKYFDLYRIAMHFLLQNLTLYKSYCSLINCGCTHMRKLPNSIFGSIVRIYLRLTMKKDIIHFSWSIKMKGNRKIDIIWMLERYIPIHYRPKNLAPSLFYNNWFFQFNIEKVSDCLISWSKCSPVIFTIRTTIHLFIIESCDF